MAYSGSRSSTPRGQSRSRSPSRTVPCHAYQLVPGSQTVDTSTSDSGTHPPTVHDAVGETNANMALVPRGGDGNIGGEFGSISGNSSTSGFMGPSVYEFDAVSERDGMGNIQNKRVGDYERKETNIMQVSNRPRNHKNLCYADI